MIKKLSVIFFIIVMLLFNSCGFADTEKVTDTRFMMDTIVTITAYTSDISVLEDAFGLCEKYEALLSKTVEGSDIWKINHSGGKPVTVSKETSELIELCIEYSEISEGLFDVTIEPLAALWDFTSAEPQVPAQDKIDEAVCFVDFRKIKKEENQITLPNGMGIDLGAAAKGFIADRVADYFRNNNIPAVINLGGNVVTVGEKPGKGSWKIGIRDPKGGANDELGTVSVGEKSLVTSGIYERSFELNGKLYHHILNPITGYPVDNDLASVTVVTDRSANGDILSTMLFLMGEERAIEYVETTDGVEAVFVLKNSDVICSSGIELT